MNFLAWIWSSLSALLMHGAVFGMDLIVRSQEHGQYQALLTEQPQCLVPGTVERGVREFWPSREWLRGADFPGKQANGMTDEHFGPHPRRFRETGVGSCVRPRFQENVYKCKFEKIVSYIRYCLLLASGEHLLEWIRSGFRWSGVEQYIL